MDKVQKILKGAYGPPLTNQQTLKFAPTSNKVLKPALSVVQIFMMGLFLSENVPFEIGREATDPFFLVYARRVHPLVFSFFSV
jgi:hypothetical protein